MTTKHRILTPLIIIVPVLLGLAIWVHFFTPAAAVRRANTSMGFYLMETNVKPTRKSCTVDSDGDGYSSCTIATTSEVIQLQCTSSFLNTLPIIGSYSCKEQYNEVMKFRGIR